MTKPDAPPAWIRLFIWIGAITFILALIVSAVFDPTIRVLHTLQALIYIAVILLARKGSAWGFGAGCLIAVFWNYVATFVNTFVRAGMEQLTLLLTTGHLARPDLLIAVFAAGGHVLLIIGCLAGFFRLRASDRSWGRFVAGGAIAIAYFVGIIVTTGSQYIPLLRRVFRL